MLHPPAARRRLAWPTAPALLCLALAGCNSTPDFLVTTSMYREAPKRVVVLPFSPQPGKLGSVDVTAKSAVACRDAFYRHFSVRPFEDIELGAVDEVIDTKKRSPAAPAPKATLDRARLCANRIVGRVDMVGLRNLLKLYEILWESPWAAPQSRDEIANLVDLFDADAYAIGATRDYGWFYAVLFSSVKVACKVEIRSCKTGALLWRGEWTRRSFTHVLDGSIWTIPYNLVQVWRNTRGEVFENVTDRTFRGLAATIPYVKKPTKPFVEAKRYRIQLYKEASAAPWHKLARVRRKGLRMPVVTIQAGWVRCRHPEWGECWVRRKDVNLVGDRGQALE